MLDQDYNIDLLNKPIDVRDEFAKVENNYFLVDKVSHFNTKTLEGVIQCESFVRKTRVSFNDGRMPFEQSTAWEFPPHYDKTCCMPIAIECVSNRTIRIKMKANALKDFEEQSLMLSKEVIPQNNWILKEEENSATYIGEEGSLTIQYNPFHIIVKDKNNKVLTKTNHYQDSMSLLNCDPIPYSIVNKIKDTKTNIASSFSLFPDEKIFGCGESFTGLNKRGQKLVLYTKDPHGVQSPNMYKPIPFFMSSRGYGMFYHTSAPMTFDFGYTYDAANISFIGDDMLDLFIFIGTPKEILEEYTYLTGRASMPPIWSFGLWMSRISYKSEEEVRAVANKLRDEKIPCDVLHLDTGWFEEEWKCDYNFSKERFDDPARMLEDLEKQGFHVSLWQYPYFTPQNKLFTKILQEGYYIKDFDSVLPTKDAIVDFSNEHAARWYKDLLGNLLKMGVSCIKADFGEAAPVQGIYASQKSGWYGHNLYPLRYNKVVSEITKEVTGENIIWARSAWAGSQRYPVHWGGDSENTLSGMKASLRAGLSLGLCGFSFWSHDIGGFVKKTPKDIYERWLPFGMLTSHARCHGMPPKEPWEYGEEFVTLFRKAVNMRYELIPYIYEEAYKASSKGYPMMRTLFFEYPEDQTAWFIDDEYLFGEKLLVAPLFEKGIEARDTYLPEGTWVDYFTGATYEGEKWHTIQTQVLPIVMLVKGGSSIPIASIAQTTGEIDWDNIQIRKF